MTNPLFPGRLPGTSRPWGARCPAAALLIAPAGVIVFTPLTGLRTLVLGQRRESAMRAER